MAILLRYILKNLSIQLLALKSYLFVINCIFFTFKRFYCRKKQTNSGITANYNGTCNSIPQVGHLGLFELTKLLFASRFYNGQVSLRLPTCPSKRRQNHPQIQ